MAMDRVFAMASAIAACVAILLLLFSKDVEPFVHLFKDSPSTPAAQTPLIAEKEPAWNVFYHLGGNGPWIPKVRGVVNDTIDPPQQCKIDQVHMVGAAIHVW